jgi:hypothetical protein
VSISQVKKRILRSILRDKERIVKMKADKVEQIKAVVLQMFYPFLE